MRGITYNRLKAGWDVCLKELSFAEVCSLYSIVREMNARGCNNWGIDKDDFCDLTEWLGGIVGGKCEEIIDKVNKLHKESETHNG